MPDSNLGTNKGIMRVKVKKHLFLLVALQY